jgi:hypothetical protein
LQFGDLVVAITKVGTSVWPNMFSPMQTIDTDIFSVLFLGAAMQLGRYWKVPDSPILCLVLPSLSSC